MLTFNAPGTTQTSSPFWSSNRTGRSVDHGKARGKDWTLHPVPAVCRSPLVKPVVWQLFDLRTPSSTDDLVLSLNQPNMIEFDWTRHHHDTPPQCFGEVLIRTLATFRSLESIECYYYTWRYLYTRKNLSNPNSCSSISLDSSSLWNKLSSSSCRFLSRSSFLAESSSSSSSSPGIERFKAIE